MPINLDKPQRWKADIAASVDMYNRWFMEFAPRTFRETRLRTTKDVEGALQATGYLVGLTPELLRKHPGVLPTLRMSTCPPLAVDRLIGLSGAPGSLVANLELEEGRLPPRMGAAQLHDGLQRIVDLLLKMADPDIFTWLDKKAAPTADEERRVETILVDRLTAARADPIIRNEQESRQMNALRLWLEKRGYRQASKGTTPEGAQPGEYLVHPSVKSPQKNIAFDLLVRSRMGEASAPIVVEAKSIGDATNSNKRMQEAAEKLTRLSSTSASGFQFVLFLGGYIAEPDRRLLEQRNIDWIWEHRIDDLAELGL